MYLRYTISYIIYVGTNLCTYTHQLVALLVTCVLQLVIDLFQDFQDHYFLVGIGRYIEHTDNIIHL